MSEDTGISMKDAKQASIVTIVALIGGLLSSAGYQVVGGHNLFTQEDFNREKQAILEYDQAQRSELSLRLRSDVSKQIKDEMEVVRSELGRNRERLDRLIENTARVGALVEQHMRYSQENEQDKEPQPKRRR